MHSISLDSLWDLEKKTNNNNNTQSHFVKIEISTNLLRLFLAIKMLLHQNEWKHAKIGCRLFSLLFRFLLLLLLRRRRLPLLLHLNYRYANTANDRAGRTVANGVRWAYVSIDCVILSLLWIFLLVSARVCVSERENACICLRWIVLKSELFSSLWGLSVNVWVCACQVSHSVADWCSVCIGLVHRWTSCDRCSMCLSYTYIICSLILFPMLSVATVASV